MNIRKIKMNDLCEKVHCPQYRDGEFYVACIFVFVLGSALIELISWASNLNLPLWFRGLFLLALVAVDLHKWYNFSTRISGKKKLMYPIYKTFKIGWENRKR